MRAETGSMQFGNDWAGVFIRGDNAGHLALQLSFILEKYEIEEFDKIHIKSIMNILNSSNQSLKDGSRQMMINFEDALKK